MDLEAARSTRPECSLNISTCVYDGQEVNTVATVEPLTFAVIQPLAFELGYVGLPATNLVSLFMIICLREKDASDKRLYILYGLYDPRLPQSSCTGPFQIQRMQEVTSFHCKSAHVIEIARSTF